MRVLDWFRPSRGVLALRLHCRCVVTLRGHRGPAPSEHPCAKHDLPPKARRFVKVRRFPPKEVERLVRPDLSELLPRTAVGSAPRTASALRRATPIGASPSAERPSSPPPCAACRRPKKIAARGLCWSCYDRSRRGQSSAPARVREPLGPSHPDVRAVGRPDLRVAVEAAHRVGAAVRAARAPTPGSMPELHAARAEVEAWAPVRQQVMLALAMPEHGLPGLWLDWRAELERRARAAGWLDTARSESAWAATQRSGGAITPGRPRGRVAR